MKRKRRKTVSTPLVSRKIYQLARLRTLLTQAGQRVHAVNVHGTATTDTLSATPAEGQGWVQLVLNPHQCVENHRPGLVEIEGVGLHTRLLGGRVRVPSVDLEALQSCLLFCGGGVGIGYARHGSNHGVGRSESRP